MKTYKIIIELSDSILEKMASIEEASKGEDIRLAMAKIMAAMLIKKRLEQKDSITVNADNIVDNEKLTIIESAIVSVGVVGMHQEDHATEKKEQEQKTLESNVGSQTSSLYNPNSSYFNPGCAEDSDGGYKLEL